MSSSGCWWSRWSWRSTRPNAWRARPPWRSWTRCSTPGATCFASPSARDARSASGWRGCRRAAGSPSWAPRTWPSRPPSAPRACVLVRGREPAGGEVERLFAPTEGWPLGVALGRRGAARGRASSRRRAGEAIFEYLAEEVFDRLEPELQRAACSTRASSPSSTRSSSARSGLPAVLSRRSSRRRASSCGRRRRCVRRFILCSAISSARRLADERDHRRARPSFTPRAAGALAPSGRAPGGDRALARGRGLRVGRRCDRGVRDRARRTAPETVAGWLERLARGAARAAVAAPARRARWPWGAATSTLAVEHCRVGVAELERAAAPDGAPLGGPPRPHRCPHRGARPRGGGRGERRRRHRGPGGGPGGGLLRARCTRRCWPRLGRRRVPIAPSRRRSHGPRRGTCSARSLAAFRAQYRDLPAGRLDDALEHDRRRDRRARGRRPVQPAPLRARVQDGDSRGAGRAGGVRSRPSTRCSRPRSAPGWPATSAPGRGSGGRDHAGAARSPRGGARSSSSGSTSDWSSWVGCDLHRRAGAARRARRRDRGAPSPRPGAASRRPGGCPPSTASASTSVLAPCSATPGEPGRRPGRRSGGVAGARSGPGDSKARARAALACVLHRAGDRKPRPRGARRRRSRRPAKRPGSCCAPSGPRSRRCSGARSRPGRSRPGRRWQPLAAAFPGGPEVVRPRRAPASRGPRCGARRRGGRGAARGARRGSPMRRASSPASEPLAAPNPPPLAFRTLGPLRVRRGVWAVEPRRLGAQGRRAGRALAARSRRRAGPRGRAARGLLAGEAARLGAARASDRDLERPRRARPALGAEQAAGARSAPTRSSCVTATGSTPTPSRPPRAGARRCRARSGSRGWRPPPACGPASRCPRSVTPTGPRLARAAQLPSRRRARRPSPRPTAASGDHAAAARAAQSAGRPRSARRARPAAADGRLRRGRPTGRRAAPVPRVPAGARRAARDRAGAPRPRAPAPHPRRSLTA